MAQLARVISLPVYLLLGTAFGALGGVLAAWDDWRERQ